MTSVRTSELFNTLVFKSENSTRLSAFSDIVFNISVNSRNSNFRTENSLSIGNGDFAVNIISVTGKQRVSLYGNSNIEVTVRTAVYTAVALT